MCLLPNANLMPFARRWHARGRGYCRGKSGRAPQHVQAYPWQAVSGKQALDWTRAEGRSIIDESVGAEPSCARVKGVNREEF